jgi:ribulose-phosphate 3-epimerase
MIIAPSILSADFGNLKASLEQVQSAKWIHVDVMDGHFVPNISIGPVVVNGIRKYTDQILDTHLMITDPLQYAEAFVKAGSDRITFHFEAVHDPMKTILAIKELGVPVGISIKPKTDVKALLTILEYVDLVLVMSVEPGFGGQAFIPEAVDKIKELATLKKVIKNNYLIEVDGGINKETGKLCKEAGVDVLVAGSYIFNDKDPEARIEDLK